MLGWGVDERAKREAIDFPFKNLITILKNSDITFGNLEAPLTNAQNKVIWDYSKILEKPINIHGKIYGNSIFCKGNPKFVESLSLAGFNILSIANNHIMDYGEKGINDTIDALIKKNIKPIGAGRNIFEARKPVIFKIKGVTIGFLAYCDTYVAGKKRAGVAAIKYAKEDVAKLKNEVDYAIVSVHQGMDIEDYPLPTEVTSMHDIIDSGADIILRHHTHVIQGIEYYNKGVIVYSLGNFVFDYSIDPLWKDIQESKNSIIFRCKLCSLGIKDVEIIPIHLNENFEPELHLNEESIKLLDHINNLSSKITSKKLNNAEFNYINIEFLLAYHVIITSLRKGQFRNIWLIVNRIEINHVKMCLKYIYNFVNKRLF